ncbi:helix-turn-helix domain-containing protein [Nocardia nova]|uniref:helix-turn-helix domain-containing protein n=1 Tax=Nocardia nova TaxID=37330 RepID=UPI0037BB2A36
MSAPTTGQPERAGRGTVLRSLLDQRNLTDYEEFRREYEQHAARLDATMTRSAPTPAAFNGWLNHSGCQPRDGFRRQVMESMFPGMSARQLFEPLDGPQHTGWIEQRNALVDTLRELRNEARMSQSEMARRCAYDRSHISKLESGNATPSYEFIAAADRVLSADGVLVDMFDQMDTQQRLEQRQVRRAYPEPAEPGAGTEWFERRNAMLDKLRELRAEARMSQSDMGRKCSYHRSYISKVETGENIPSREFISVADRVLSGDGSLIEMYDRMSEYQPVQQRHLRPVPTFDHAPTRSGLTPQFVPPVSSGVRKLMSWVDMDRLTGMELSR